MGHNDTWTYVNSNNLSSWTYTVTQTDPAGNQTLYTFYRTFQTERQVYQGTVSPSNLLSTTITCYNASFSNCPTSGPPTGTLRITQTDVFTYPKGSSSASAVETKYNQMATVAEVKNYDYGAATSLPPTGPPAGSPLTDTTMAYDGNGASCGTLTASNIFDRPCSIATVNSSGTLSKLSYTYNGAGHAIQTSTFVNNSTSLTSYATFNANGAMASFTDVNGATTNYYYNGTGGCNNLMLTSTVFPVDSLSTSQTWDCNGGVLTSTTDTNGKATTYGYVDQGGTADPFWRVLSVTDALSNTTWTTYSGNATTEETALNFPISNPTSTVDILTTRDGLGRAIATQHRTAPGANSFDQTIQYTYGWTSSAGSFVRSTTPGGTATTTTQLDAMGRAANVTDGGGGAVSVTYAQNDVLRTVGPAPSGEHVKSRQYEYDGIGRITSVCEILSSGGSSCGQNTAASGYKTAYSYSVPSSGGSQMVVTQGTQQRTYVYDGRGRVISETNPESGSTTYIYDSVAANYCTSSPAYNSNGDLVAKSDANGTHICYYYDQLHRLTDTANNNESVTNPCQRFRYDNSTGVLGSIPSGVTVSNTFGHVVEAETDTCAAPITQASMLTDEWFSYSTRGETTDLYEMTPHSAGYYHSTAAYWANGTLQSLSGIPGYTALSYGVDGEGRMTTASQGTLKVVCDSSCSPSSTTFDAGGRPWVVTIGGTSDNDTYVHDASTGRINSFTFTVGSTPKSIGGTLTWNQNGSLRQLAITDTFNSGGAQTCNFGTASVAGYDDLGRLLSANCGSVWQQTFSYDQFGNITKTGSSSWACPVCYNGNNQYNSTLSGSISYDKDGNLLDDTFNKYTWDVYGHLATIGPTSGTITCGTSGTCLTYDANGRVVEKNVAGVYTEILYSPMGKTAIMKGQTTNSAYFPLPAGETLFESGSNGGTRNFWHKDWLGTVRFSSTVVNRTSVYDRAFAPFGEAYNNFGATTNYNFTGDTQDVDVASGLFDAANRELHPGQGRWISPDPAGLNATDLTNPQTWNRYAYALNNPLSNIDPTGLFCVWDDGSFDSNDDPLTGNQAACEDTYGGTWFNGSPWDWDPTAGDWSGQASLEFAGWAQGINPNVEPWGPPSNTPDVTTFGGAAPQVQLIGGDNTRDQMLAYLRSCEGTAPGGGFGAYNDSLGNCTTGFGHLVHLHPCTAQDIANYSGQSQGQAEAQLEADYDTAREWVTNNAPGLNTDQQNAMVDLVFNMGPNRLQTHDVWTDVVNGNLNQVPADIQTLRAGGTGIAQRRANEAAMFTNGVYPTQCY